jgi:hypothetical protein
MTREERAIQILEQRACCRECVVGNCTCAECDEAFDMAIKALEQKDWKFYYDHGYAQAKRDLQEPKTGHWIPVSERLPEINDDVLISLEWGIDIGRYSGGEWCSEWINNYDDGNVYAWMPLPEPYEPQESEKE